MVPADTQFSIHPKTLIGALSLSVSDLQRQVNFYRDYVGLALLWQKGSEAALGTPEAGARGGETLLHLKAEPTFKRYRGVTGMYHFAILLPNQRELARSLGRLIAKEWPNSPTDHIMTKTPYFDDPEGNGLELYAESPEDGTWSLAGGKYVTRRKDGSLSTGREALDVEALLGHLMKEDRLDAPVPLIASPGFQIFSSVNELFLTSEFEEFGFRNISAEVVKTAFTAIPSLPAANCANEEVEETMTTKTIRNKLYIKLKLLLLSELV